MCSSLTARNRIGVICLSVLGRSGTFSFLGPVSHPRWSRLSCSLGHARFCGSRSFGSGLFSSAFPHYRYSRSSPKRMFTKFASRTSTQFSRFLCCCCCLSGSVPSKVFSSCCVPLLGIHTYCVWLFPFPPSLCFRVIYLSSLLLLRPFCLSGFFFV